MIKFLVIFIIAFSFTTAFAEENNNCLSLIQKTSDIPFSSNLDFSNCNLVGVLLNDLDLQNANFDLLTKKSIQGNQLFVTLRGIKVTEYRNNDGDKKTIPN